MGNLLATRSSTVDMCSTCHRDRDAPYHEGWNGWFIDENLICYAPKKLD